VVVNNSTIKGLRLAGRSALLILSLLLSGTVFSQEIPRGNPTAQPTFRIARLVSPGAGWAVVDEPSPAAENAVGAANQHLYWTDNDGQNWHEITPDPMLTKNLGSIFFLDRSHGWILATDALGEEEGANFYLYTTKDGGKSWTSLLLRRQKFNLRDDYTFPSEVFFSDSEHGWILWHWRVMNSELDALLATSDGGRTWKRLPDAPGAGPFQFISPHDGWIIGAPALPKSVPVPEAQNLWVSHDGGLRWNVVSVSLPADADPDEMYLVDLKFANSRDGTLAAAQQISGRLFRFFSFSTADSGKTWRVSRFEAYSATPSFVDGHIIWSVSDSPAGKLSLRIENRVVSPVPPRPSVRVGDVNFASESNGWAFWFDNPSGLVATVDGGRTFRVITPPIARLTK
jgi:photosystem II stability/assembly factor-like uncharacterized protein